MRKLVSITLLVLLVATLLSMSCTAPKPSPTPKPAPAPAAPAAPKPTVAAPAKPITLTFSSGMMGPPDKWSETVAWYLDEVTKRTGGKVTFTRHWGGALTKMGEELEAVSKGVVDVGLIVITSYPDRLAANNWRSAMWWTPKQDVLAELYPRLYEEPGLAAEWTKANQKVLATSFIGGGYNIQTKRPVNSLADLKGLRMAASGKYFPLSLQPLGVVISSIHVGERYTALQTGLLDSVLSGVPISASYGLFDFIKYSYDIGHIGSGNAITVNSKVWDGLPQDVKKVMQDLAPELAKYSIKAGSDEAASLTEKFAKSGVTFGKWSDETLTQWANTMPNIIEMWIKDVEPKGVPAREIMKSVLKEFEKAGFRQPGGKVWVQ